MNKSENDEININNLIRLFENTHKELQNQAARSVDTALVVRNWLFGWYIVEFENGAAKRKELYGKALMHKLSDKLTGHLGRGFSLRSLEQFRKFYLSYHKITQTVSSQSFLPNQGIEKSNTIFNDFSSSISKELKLSWSHYVVLLTIKSEAVRNFYEIEALDNNWGIRELKRQIASSLYERLALSRDKEKVIELSKKGHVINSAEDILKNPYVLEFLNLPEYPHYSEHELEIAIIDKIEHFLLCNRKNDALVELTLPEKVNIHASEYQLYLPSKEELKKQLEDVQKKWEIKS